MTGIFREVMHLDDYRLLSLDMSECYTRIAKELISAPIITEMVETGQIWFIACSPFQNKSDLKMVKPFIKS